MSVDVATRVMRADAAAAAAAARALAEGGLVAFPTETVYGLGADAGPSGRPRDSRGVCRARGRALGQSIRPPLADQCRPCARGSRGPDRPPHRWRTDAGRDRIDRRRLPRRDGFFAAPRRAAPE